MQLISNLLYSIPGKVEPSDFGESFRFATFSGPVSDIFLVKRSVIELGSTRYIVLSDCLPAN